MKLLSVSHIVFLIAALLAFFPFSASAANHYIRPGATGLGLGTDWTNAYSAIPSLLIRGDTYYLASGNYGGTTFNTPQVGALRVFLKKATAADHGTNLGWQSPYGTGQAVFSSSGVVWRINMNYLTVDGITGSGTSGFGIKLYTSGLGNGTSGVIASYYGDSSSYLSLNHIEIAGIGPGGKGAQGNFIYGFYSNIWDGVTTNYSFLNCYVHDVYSWMRTSGVNNVVIDHGYFKNAGSSDGSAHGVGFTFQGSNWTLRYSTLENMIGSANTTYVEPQNHPHDVYVYGNVYLSTHPEESTTQWSALSLTSTDLIDNLYFYNNTIIGLRGRNPGVSAGNNAGSTNVYVYNNVWKECVNDPTLSQVDHQWNNILNAGGIIPVTLANVSSRLRVGTGDDVLIGGFIITGTQSKNIVLRAIGPSLPLVGSLGDPTLELHDASGRKIASNDNWTAASNSQAIGNTGLAPTNPLESAILATLNPGAYTAIVRGNNNTTGIALVEEYDLSPNTNGKLANVATRGLVQTNDNVLIGGFIIVGAGKQKVIIRAIGPSLPLSRKLMNPTLELRDPFGALISSNDDWRSTQESEIIATTIPPKDNAESAIVATLDPGPYTAIVRGKNGSSGIALVEVYAIN